MALTTPAYVYCTQEDMEALYSVDGVLGRVDDNVSGTIAAPETTYITKALYWATSQVNFYCLAVYADSALATSYMVNEWATILACRWLSSRRANPIPESIEALYRSAIEDMKLVRSGTAQIPDIGARDAMFPAWSNVRVDVTSRLRKCRVERPISEPTPTPYRQDRDWSAEALRWEQ